MGKLSASKRRVDRRISKKDVSDTMGDEHYLDSNSDSGLDVGGPDSESHEGLSAEAPCTIFKNPSIISYENAVEKLLLPIFQAHHSSSSPLEPPVKKARMSRTDRSSARVTGFCDLPSVGTNYADLVLEEANLECPQREARQLPELQNVLKTILSRTEACNGTQDLTAGQTKSETSSKTPPQSLQTNDGTNGTARGGSALSGALSGSGRRMPVGRRQLTLCMNFPPKSKNGQVELRILSQPEEQHRARYLTEGSRGAVKDRIGSGYPTIKLFGYCKPVTLQVFIGTDQGKVQPHLFYQASKVCGKNSAPCSQKKIDGTVVLELSLLPEKDMTLSCDCIGILKERNVDVEQRLLHFGGTRSKKRSTRCRLVFRALITDEDGSVEILQTASAPIVCTQPPGIPEICRKSLSEGPAVGKVELFVIGKNFLKDTEVVFEGCSRDNCDDHHSLGSSSDCWRKVVIPEKDFLQPNHLICTVPPYHDTKIRHPVRVRLLVQSSGKRSEPQNFTYLPVTHVACPLPGLAPLASCVTDTALGLVQQPPQKPVDILPALIQLPLGQPTACGPQEQQIKRTILAMPPAQEMNPQLKQEDNRGQQMVITTLVIPSTSEGALTQAATTRILQDSQHTVQAVANSASSNSSGIENPIKTSHIQVLVMPPSSSSVSVTTSPRVVTSSTSLQDSIINNLKANLSSNIVTICNSETPQFETQKQTSFSDVTNEPDLSDRTFQQSGFPLSIANTSFTTLPKEVRTIQDLLLQDSEKTAMFGGNNDLNTRLSQAVSDSFQNSLRSGLGSSLENIPVQSLIQASANADLQEQNIRQSNFVIGSEGSSFSTATQKASSYADMIEKPTLNTVFQMGQGIIKHEPKEAEAPMTSNFEVSVNSMMLNPDVTGSLGASNPVQDSNQTMSQDIGALSNSPSFNQTIDSYFAKERNLIVSEHSCSSQPPEQDRQFEHVSVPNPVLTSTLAEVNLSEPGSTLKSFTSNIGEMSPSENGFQMSSVNTYAPSIGKTISTSESQLIGVTGAFPTSITTSNTLDSIAVTNATSLLNFQDKFQLALSKNISENAGGSSVSFSLQNSLLNKEFSKGLELQSSQRQNVTDAKFNNVLLNPALVSPENFKAIKASLGLEGKFRVKSPLNKISLSNGHVTIGIQDLNNLSQDSNTVNFQNLNSGPDVGVSFVENRSATLGFQNPITSSEQALNILSSISENVSMPNESSHSGAHTSLCTVPINSRSQNVPFKAASQNMSMPDLGPLEDAFGNQDGKSIASSQESNSFPSATQNGSLENQPSVESALANFHTSAQSLGLSPEGTNVRYIEQSLDSVGRVHGDIISFTNSNPVISGNTLQGNMTAQSLGSITNSQEAVTFTLSPQNLNLTSETPCQKTFACENLSSVNALQDQMASFTTTTNTVTATKPDETAAQTMRTNQNLEANCVCFTTSIQNAGVKSEPSLQEVYSQQNLLTGSSVQDGLMSFTRDSQSIGESFPSQTMGPMGSTQGLVSFTTPVQNVNGASTQGNSFDQQNLLNLNNSQESLSGMASKAACGSVSTGGPTVGPSMEQMSTIMSLLPDSELLKIINPSTFDKM